MECVLSGTFVEGCGSVWPPVGAVSRGRGRYRVLTESKSRGVVFVELASPDLMGVAGRMDAYRRKRLLLPFPTFTSRSVVFVVGQIPTNWRDPFAFICAQLGAREFRVGRVDDPFSVVEELHRCRRRVSREEELPDIALAPFSWVASLPSSSSLGCPSAIGGAISRDPIAAWRLLW